MKIRKATMDDLQAIAGVEAACFPQAEAATKEQIKERLSYYGNHFWLLYEEGTLVGFIDGMVTDETDLCDEMYEDASMHKEDGKWQMIFGVNTIPEYRRRGCAAAIMNRVIKDAKEEGREGLVLTCKERLLSYYAKFGFINEGISGSEHGNVIWYQMRLRFN
ncbi:acetyltransferase GNAT family protein [Lachnospiraceae bacterium KM106-2]|nr:acetyltransferase GNAT family protein [Lachnospiraceae bacterium KM106-2]